jgi:hypothetical protein
MKKLKNTSKLEETKYIIQWDYTGNLYEFYDTFEIAENKRLSLSKNEGIVRKVTIHYDETI